MLIKMAHISVYRLVLFPLLCALQCCRCLPFDFQSTTEPAVLGDQASQEWRALHTEMFQFPGNTSHSYSRDVRFLQRGPKISRQKKYQACTAPGNRGGHCKHLSACPSANRTYFPQFMDYMCIIENTYVGVCCPDSVGETRTKKIFYDELAGILPAIASLDDVDFDIEGELDESRENADENGPSASTAANGDANLGKDATSAKQETGGPRKPRGCGTTTKMRIRIAGGQPADPQEWPWMAALLRQGAIQYCGGVLITDRHVLTAAHCVYRYKPRDITVRLGEYDFTTSEETRTLDFAVSEIRIHRDFKLSTYEHDIAIIKINRPTAFNSYIWPICLPPVQQSFENKNAVVTGWGTQYYGGPASTVLLETEVPVWPQERCVRSFTQLIPNTTLCAGAYEGGRDACQGDSGGPLLHQLANGRWVSIGIVSWGIRCGEPGYPGIYTRVSSYLDWIFANAVF
ncbi:PREDICTED: proclotting enzyme-like [Vollenhovia emeryi]|uniref:proclotting enzyme-like n=1 Tax=Vollenhovia emeryi TaxID=411798 RepID=UPI0005F467FD|nr:PREDICTED: proclotting enzyme-like [Vollenhovia emeryi]